MKKCSNKICFVHEGELCADGEPNPANCQYNCWCETCRPLTLDDMRMIVCPDCGDKRCPRAVDHRNACTGKPNGNTEAITDDQIRSIFIAHGFTVKEGQTDLKPYVFQAARALLTQAVAQVKAQPVNKQMLEALCETVAEDEIFIEECKSQGQPLADEFLTTHRKCKAAITQAEKQQKTNLALALQDFGHGNPEDRWVKYQEHLNCPACGGSGHVDDGKTVRGLTEEQIATIAEPLYATPEKARENLPTDIEFAQLIEQACAKAWGVKLNDGEALVAAAEVKHG